MILCLFLKIDSYINDKDIILISETINSVILCSEKILKLKDSVIKNIINKLETILKDNDKTETLIVLKIFEGIFKEIQTDSHRISVFKNLIKHFFEVNFKI